MGKEDREYDKTHLSIDTAEERVLVHRDYIAHCLRWSHVVKRLYKGQTYKTARILDIGCGKEMPLAKALYSNRMSGASYIGMDLNKVEIPAMLEKAVESGKLYIEARGQTNACQVSRTDLPWVPNMITSFEVAEHMAPKHCYEYLHTIYQLLDDEGVAILSTPCFNGKAAANHINEMTYEFFGAMMEMVGFTVEESYGTFASISDYKHKFTPEQADLFDQLRNYYDTNMLAILFAPCFPAESRNALWVVSKKHEPNQFKNPHNYVEDQQDVAGWQEVLDGLG